MSSRKDHSDSLSGLKKFLLEAKKILSINDPLEHAENIEKIDSILERLDPMIEQEEKSSPSSTSIDEKKLSGIFDSTKKAGWGANKKPLIAGESAQPLAGHPLSAKYEGPFASTRHEREFEKVSKLADEMPAPPQALVETLKAWLLERWKTPAYWESMDQIEQTWHLQQLVRKLFKSGGIERDPQFIQGSRKWASETIGEIRKLGMGAPSIVWCVHEIVHLALEEEEEGPAWAATVRFIRDSFADIDPAYAKARLEAEFDNQQLLTPAKPVGKTDTERRGWN